MGAYEAGLMDGEKPKAGGAFSPDALTAAALMAAEMMRCGQVRDLTAGPICADLTSFSLDAVCRQRPTQQAWARVACCV